ncbi:hypothetical protein D3C75_776950 [compost metagenome]
MRSRWVTARNGDQTGFFQFVAFPFRQAINRLLKQLRMLMRKAIIELIKLSIVNAECTGKIDDDTAFRQKLRRQVMAHFMGCCEEHHVYAVSKFADI